MNNNRTWKTFVGLSIFGFLLPLANLEDTPKVKQTTHFCIPSDLRHDKSDPGLDVGLVSLVDVPIMLDFYEEINSVN